MEQISQGAAWFNPESHPLTPRTARVNGNWFDALPPGGLQTLIRTRLGAGAPEAA